MVNLRGKRIILGVTGSIAAYKSAYLTRALVKAGAEVRVVMTPSAAAFITPLTLSTLSKNDVYTDVVGGDGWNNHVELGLWADAMLIAPMTATTLAKTAAGLSDSMVVATYLSARCPVFFAPAMDLDMWQHPATRNNIDRLLSYGNHLIPVAYGELASGLTGEGRMAEPGDIIRHLDAFFASSNSLQGKRLLITAGPTYEPLDPVRFIGNRSSGRMGMALAKAAAKRGAEVHLLLGPSRLSTEINGVHIQRVQTAQEMYEAAVQRFPETDIAIMAAAVSDYRPAETATEKIKKKDGNMHLQLVRNPDIAAALGNRKKPGQLLIGFALETSDEQLHAEDKLIRKNFDFIVLNSLRDEGAGFDHDTNKVAIIFPGNKMKKFELKSKTAVAADILDEISALLSGSEAGENGAS